MSISILIPVFNQRDALKRTLRSLIPEKQDHEVIVVDLGSTDGTADVVKEYDWARTLSPTARPRSAALNEAVSGVTGDFLLFLEPGSLPARGWSEAISTHLGGVADAGHLICKEVDSSSPWASTLRSLLWRIGYQVTGGPSGLNGVIVKKEVFDQLEGFRPVPDFEWLAFSNRLKESGSTVKVLKHDLLMTPKPGSDHADAFRELKEDLMSSLTYRKSQKFDDTRSRRQSSAAILIGYDFFNKPSDSDYVAKAREELLKISLGTLQSFRGVGSCYFIGGAESTRLIGQPSGVEVMGKPRTKKADRFAELRDKVLAEKPEGIFLVRMGISTELDHKSLFHLSEGPAENPCVIRPIENTDEWVAIWLEKAALESLPSLEITETITPLQKQLSEKIIRSDVEKPVSALQTDSDARGMFYAGHLQEQPA
jgi:glycosyltransferase involved in cell wall biosynthesis